MILFYFMNSALVNNQTNADTSLQLALVALVTCVLTAVILLLVVFLRRRSCRGVYKTFFPFIFNIAYTFWSYSLEKIRKKYLFLTGIRKTAVKVQQGNLSKEISCYFKSQNRFTWLGYNSCSDAHFVTLLELLKMKQFLYFCVSR